MGGKRLGSYRSGDRSEYLALYALSRISFVTPLPRQEDFGIMDFLCVLTKQKNLLVYPENAFYVQVKSNEDDIIYDKDSADWIFNHMDIPLILCVVDKKQSLLKFFSCWNIWPVLFLQHNPEKITLKLKTPLPLEEPMIDKTKNITIPLGQPIIKATVEEFEKNPDMYYKVLKSWLDLDKRNIARRQIGAITLSGFVNWTINEDPETSKSTFRNLYYGSSKTEKAEKEIVPILTGLAYCYNDVTEEKQKLDAIKGMLKELRKYLDNHGIAFADDDPKLKRDRVGDPLTFIQPRKGL